MQTSHGRKAIPLHQPERGADESHADYRARRKASRAAARDLTTAPTTLHNRRTPGARESFRKSMRDSGTMGKRIRASDALMAAWASKRVTKAVLRDEHGAITLVGKPYEIEGVHPTTREFVRSSWVDGDDFGYTVQRKWLGGISAQRGY